MASSARRARPDLQSVAVTALLTVLVALGQISTALYIPSMPSLVAALGTDMERVNLTFTIYLAGFAVSQLIYGPLSDRYGRRRVLIGGLVLFLVSSLGCAVASTIEALIAGRLLQAVGACAGPVLGRAVVRDIYDQAGTARVMAYIGVAFAVSPAITPMIGGYLQVWFGWRASFVFLAVAAALVLAAVWMMLDETNPEPNPHATRPAEVARTFGMLVKSPAYLGHTLSVALIFSGLMAYTAAAPFIFIDRIGLTPDRFGMLAVFTVMGYLAGTLAAGRLTLSLGVERMVLAGNVLALAGGVAMVAVALAGDLTIARVIAPMMVFLVGMGIVLPNGMAGAMGPFPKTAGAASALLGFFQMAVAAAASMVAGLFSHTTLVPLSLIVAGVAVLALATFLPLVWMRRVTAPHPRSPDGVGPR